MEALQGRSLSRYAAIAIAVAVLTALVIMNLSGSGQEVNATHQPADKVTARGSALEWLKVAPSAVGVKGDNAELKPILQGTLRTSTPTDLILAVTAECALWTSTANKANGASETEANVEMFITITRAGVTPDPTVGIVPVSTDDGDSPGRVVFCNRAERMETEGFEESDSGDDDDEEIRSYQRSRTANAFNWLALNVGNGIHTITLWAELDAWVAEADTATAEFDFGTEEDPLAGPAAAAIGKRTLIVQPAKLANDATVSSGV